MIKRPLIILVADGTMKAVFQAFFRRPQFFNALGCAEFDFDPATEIVFDALRAKGFDGGVYSRCDDLLRNYLKTHEHAMVVIDRQFGGESPATQVRNEMMSRLLQSGWSNERIEVVIIDPELEVWMWQDNPNVWDALNCRSSLREDLLKCGNWPAEAAKPLQPKETIMRIIKDNRAGAPLAVYSKIASKVAVSKCTDESFTAFRSTVQGWFPQEEKA